ncbi:MAG: hypothetical protein HPY64_02205 [Anaerolineae bacterium]|nr:hypothetical protein [Anaerolineae bacterium]
MHRHHGFPFAVLFLILLLTACGGGATPTSTPQPTDTPAPTNTPAPTRTPEPTVDLAALSAPELYATVEALQEELTLEEQHLQQASGSEGASVQAKIDQLRAQIRELTTLAEAAGGAGGSEVTETLTLTGLFAEAREWTWAEIEALGMQTVTAAGPKEDDPEAEYTGVSLAAFLEAAGVEDGAATLVATAADDFTAEIDLAAAKTCADCLIIRQDEGGLRLVMPGFPSKNWVQDIVSLEAK